MHRLFLAKNLLKLATALVTEASTVVESNFEDSHADMNLWRECLEKHRGKTSQFRDAQVEYNWRVHPIKEKEWQRGKRDYLKTKRAEKRRLKKEHQKLANQPQLVQPEQLPLIDSSDEDMQTTSAGEGEVRPGLYRHFKGGDYTVKEVALMMSDDPNLDEKPCVVYVSHKTGNTCVRMLDNFIEKVEKPEYSGPRFYRVAD